MIAQKHDRTITKDCHYNHLYFTNSMCLYAQCIAMASTPLDSSGPPLSNGSVAVSVSECKEEPNPRCYRPSLPSHKTEVGQECGASIGPISCLTTCCLAPRSLRATCCSGTTMTTTAAAESCSESLKKLVAIAQPKTANCLPLLVGVTIK